MIYFVSINYQSSALMARLLQSIPKSHCRVVLVNNSPEDEQIWTLASKQVTILEANRNLGFGCACNLALRWIYERDTDALVWIVNPDAYLLENPLEKLYSFCQAYPHLSILGTPIKTFEGEIWFAGGRLKPRQGEIRVERQCQLRSAPQPCDWVSGCSLILNLSRFSECPRFNPQYFLYYEDVEFCHRYASAGHHIAMMQELVILHEPSSITNRNPFLKTRHSTYSYLLTLEALAIQPAFVLRLLKLICHGILLSFYQPKQALGKFCGVGLYFRQRWSRSEISAPCLVAARPKIAVESAVDSGYRS